MRPDFYILNKNEVIGTVYKKGDKEIVFMQSPDINLEWGVKFITDLGSEIQDDELMEVFVSYLKRVK